MVHLLTDSQADLASRFARDRASSAPTRAGIVTVGLPVLDDVLAWLQLGLTNRFSVGDHALVIGQVIASWHAAAELASRGSSTTTASSRRWPSSASTGPYLLRVIR